MAGYGAPYPKSTPSSPAQRLCRLLALSTMMHTRSGLLPCARINQQRRRALSERTARPTTTVAYRDPLQTRSLAQRGTLYRNEWGSQVDARTVALENAPVQLRGAGVRLPLQHRQRRAGSTPYLWTDNPVAVDPEDARRIAMAGDPVIGHILDERAADLASGPRAEEGAQDWFATRLSTHPPSFGPRGIRRHGASYAIHRSAWKGNSANFAITEFSEVRSRGRPTPVSPIRQAE